MLKIILLVFMIGFACAVEVELECPEEIFADEEFDCLIEVSDGSGIYDVKIDLDGERVSILEFWSGKSWKSGWYYFNDFVEDGNEETLTLSVSEVGRHKGVLKLRQGDNVKSFDIEIKVGKAREVVEIVEESVEEVRGEVRTISLKQESEIISLGGNVAGKSEPEWDYVSKDGHIADLLPYGFCLFLILFVGLLMWWR